MNTRSDWPDHIAAIRADTERMAVAYETGPTDAPVAACPGWDVRRLIEHMAYIHRWAAFAVRSGRAPEATDVARPAESADLAAWLRLGGNTLADDLAARDPGDDTWHVFPAEQKMWVWARRQAQETAMHRWDAEMATLGASTLDPVLAAEGVQEYFELGLPRVLSREGVDPPSSVLRVRSTDVDGDWVISAVDGTCTVTSGHDPADAPEAGAVLDGPAESLILVLMGRAGRSEIGVSGDQDVADQWLSLPGW
jgi:uncharacterized protein (TIGR03083 family)